MIAFARTAFGSYPETVLGNENRVSPGLDRYVTSSV